jgi:ribose/xylose/arabinose/galactoside ABC-type transport system permease subunit
MSPGEPSLSRPTVARERVGSTRRLFAGRKDYLVTAFSLIVVVVIFSSLSPAFLTVGNLLDISRVVSIIGIMAMGMTLVMLIGGIDLSVGSTLALAGAVAASLVPGSYSGSAIADLEKMPVALAVVAGLLAGGLIGFINGFIVAKSRIEPFIVTLGSMVFVRGLTYLYTAGYPVLFKPMQPAFAWVGQGYVFGVPTPVIFFVAITLLCFWITTRTSLGRFMYAIGGNEEASRLSGLPVFRVKTIAYSLVGVFAALSGIILASRVAAASPLAGAGYELDVIASVVIGGTSLQGGRGSIIGTLIGVFILGVIANGLNILGVPTYSQYVVKGLVLIAAVGVDGYLRKRERY